jgi:3-phosphoshikimate 1-carboxyvinyltransferase
VTLPDPLSDPLPIEPLTTPPRAAVRVPGSKSYTNRALVCALLASGRSAIRGALDSDDTRAMAAAIAALGARVQWVGDTIMVDGTGGALTPGPVALDVRDSGTCARFLLPVLARGVGRYVLDGSEQLRRRPMKPMADALRSVGVVVEGDSLPLTVLGTGARPGAEVAVPGNVTSQFISGLLLAGFQVRAVGDVVSAPYIEMTQDVLAAFSAGGTEYEVEPDASAASYFFAAAALFEGSEVTVEGLGSSSRQGDLRFVDTLEDMGCVVERSPGRTTVRGPAVLAARPQVLFLTETPDVAQTLAAVAVFARGLSTIRGIGFARAHETDRIAAVVAELQRLGIKAREYDDGFAVEGGTPVAREPVRTYGDHRMAMSFALLGLRVPGIEIENPGCVAKTFPHYWSVLESLRR